MFSFGSPKSRGESLITWALQGIWGWCTGPMKGAEGAEKEKAEEDLAAPFHPQKRARDKAKSDFS